MSRISGNGVDGLVLSDAALQSHNECALSQVSARSDITLDVARMLNNNKQTSFIIGSFTIHQGLALGCFVVTITVRRT